MAPVAIRRILSVAGRRAVFILLTGVMSCPLLWTGAAVGAARYTERQLDAMAARVGKVFWIKSADGKLPLFRSAPAPEAASFAGEERQSFEITELIGRKTDNPFYKVKFPSGKEGYIAPERFHDELNLTILTVDPYADEIRKAEEAAKEENARVEWIQAQPWAPDIKRAAIQKQAVPGLTANEIKKVLGAPSQILRLRGPSKVQEERWYYPDGRVLTFYNGLLSIVNYKEKK